MYLRNLFLLCSSIASVKVVVSRAVDTTTSRALNPRYQSRLHFEGCNSTQIKETELAWDNIQDFMKELTKIDLANDPAGFDFFGPYVAEQSRQDAIFRVFENVGKFPRAYAGGKRVNIFCQAADEELFGNCDTAFAYQWDTMCKDGKCPCKTRDSDGKCDYVGEDGNGGIVETMDPNAYMNYMFCDSHFATPHVDDLIDQVQAGEEAEKSKLQSYFDNQESTLLHEILHGEATGAIPNDELVITDVYLKIKVLRHHNQLYDTKWVDEYKAIQMYTIANAKILARSISDEDWDWTRRNSDTWAAYAMAKYVEAKLGEYPSLPVVEYSNYTLDSNDEPENTMLLDTQEGPVINGVVYQEETGNDPKELTDGNTDVGTEVAIVKRSLNVGEARSLKLVARRDEEYPAWYIEHLNEAKKIARRFS